MHIRKYLYSALECPFDPPWLLLSLHINWPWEPETGTEDGFEEMEPEFPFGTFRPEKTAPPSEPEIPEILTKWKAPFASSRRMPGHIRKFNRLKPHLSHDLVFNGGIIRLKWSDFESFLSLIVSYS